jgi:hypothetical protein
MNRKARARLAARKKASRPDRFIEDGYSHWKFSKGNTPSSDKVRNVDIPADEISQSVNSGEEDEDEDLSASAGDGQAPVAHSHPTLVTDFDPSQARDTHGRWSPSGKANAFDHVLEHSGTEKNQTVRDFYKTVHRDVSTIRPAGDPRFHDPLRLHIEQQLHELAGDHGEALYRTGAAGMTQIAFKKHEVNVVTDAPGQVTIFSEHLHGPDPRDPTTFTITHETPHEEVSYRLRKAAGLKVDKVAAEKYMAEDKKARNEFRAQRKAALEAQKTAREARRAEREARRASTQNESLSAEDISVLINSGELDVNAICNDSGESELGNSQVSNSEGQ